MSNFLSGHAGVKSGAKVGAVGYCMTGRMALFTAAVRPDRVGAVASFHGGQLCTDALDSPHLLLQKMNANLYIAHASDDYSMPAGCDRETRCRVAGLGRTLRLRDEPGKAWLVRCGFSGL